MVRARTASLVLGCGPTKKLRLNGRSVEARILRATLRKPSGSMDAQPSDPKPPALLTAAASSGVAEPAIGAWMIGCSIFSRSHKRRFGHMSVFPVSKEGERRQYQHTSTAGRGHRNCVDTAPTLSLSTSGHSSLVMG